MINDKNAWASFYEALRTILEEHGAEKMIQGLTQHIELQKLLNELSGIKESRKAWIRIHEHLILLLREHLEEKTKQELARS
ncbi:MAG: hypothetical protein NC238_10320 [Dehalobacter sp.]|nr:hypothetical protein [Dehalobacter sp.]